MKIKKVILCTMIISTLMLATGCTSDEARQTIKLDRSLPKTYSEGVEEQMQEVMDSYEALSDEDKADVKLKKYNKLQISHTQELFDAIPQGESEETISAMFVAIDYYNDIREENKGKIDKSNYDNIYNQMVEKYVVPLNEKINAFSIDFDDVDGAKKVIECTKEIFDMIDATPVVLDPDINYEYFYEKTGELTERMSVELDKVNDQSSALLTIIEETENVMNYSEYSESALKGYCTNMENCASILKNLTDTSIIEKEIKNIKKAQFDSERVMSVLNIYQNAFTIKYYVTDALQKWTDVGEQYNKILDLQYKCNT